ncbi:unnamed protein product, partial [Polarella glacialis]
EEREKLQRTWTPVETVEAVKAVKRTRPAVEAVKAVETGKRKRTAAEVLAPAPAVSAEVLAPAPAASEAAAPAAKRKKTGALPQTGVPQDSGESSKLEASAVVLVDAAKSVPSADHKFKVFVGNLPWTVSKGLVKTEFARCGDIERFDLPTNKEGRPTGIAFVYYETEDAVQKALKLDATMFHGLMIKVTRTGSGSKNKRERREEERLVKEKFTVFVAKLAPDTDPEVLKKDFSECGQVQSVKMLRNEKGGFIGTAFIVFKTEAEVKQALTWHDQPYGRNRIIVRLTEGSGPFKKLGSDKDVEKKEWDSDVDRTVCIGPLRDNTESLHLKRDFEECGEIEEVRLLKDKEGWFKGAAFVVMKTQAGLKKILEWNGKSYQGRVIKVSNVKSREGGKSETGNRTRKF